MISQFQPLERREIPAPLTSATPGRQAPCVPAEGEPLCHHLCSDFRCAGCRLLSPGPLARPQHSMATPGHVVTVVIMGLVRAPLHLLLRRLGGLSLSPRRGGISASSSDQGSGLAEGGEEVPCKVAQGSMKTVGVFIVEKHTKHSIYHFNHIQVCSSVALNAFAVLCSHSFCLVPEHSFTPNTPTPHPSALAPRFPVPPAPGSH